MDMYTLLYFNNQQEPTVWHMELCSMLYGSLDRREIWGRMDTCVRMAESLCYSPETITALLIGYTSIQNKKFLKKKNLDLVNSSRDEGQPTSKDSKDAM